MRSADVKIRRSHAVFAVALVFVAGAAIAEEPKFAAYPAEVQLDHARDAQRLVLVERRADGVTLDLTSAAEVVVEPVNLAVWENGFLKPSANGAGKVLVKAGEHALELPLRVQGVEIDPPMSFRNDIEPVLMRAGCNTGGCHGSARGQNGFHLTLFGYDPGLDYLNLTRETLGRRLNVAYPEQSLMLTKPTGEVDHIGGTVLAKDGILYNMMHRWIAEGAQDDPKDVKSLVGIEMLPKEVVLEGEGATQQFVVMAKYSDGTDRDVTELTVLSSVDESIVSVDERGLATAGQRGEGYLMARFGTFAVVSQSITVAKGVEPFTYEEAPKNYIDERIYEKYTKVRLKPAVLADDESFLRRVYVDILGVLPTVEETRQFLASEDPDKRARLIDALLERPEFAELWAMKWAEVLRVKSVANVLDTKGMHRYNDWLRHAITNNLPMDELVKQLLTAEGGNFTSPAANFYLVERQPELMAENVAQVFMGIQLQCAQCHNHPFERWTMDDYYSFSAFFAQVGRKGSTDPRETIVFNSGSGEVKNLRDGQVMAPKFLGGTVPEVKGQDRRSVLAEWLASEQNPWFAQNIANRVWEHFFGRGIIDPVDDVRVSNPPSNPQLLEELGARLASYRYDMRQLIRDICNSNTYQRSTQAPPESAHDARNFSFAQVRRLPSEILLDAVSSVTDTQVKFRQLPMGARAVQVADGNSGNYFLEVFGRPSRDSACTCERRNEPTLAQALHLINGSTFEQAMKSKEGRLAQQLSGETTNEQIIEELYLAAYARFPRSDEQERMIRYVGESEDRQQALEDVYWSVLNSKEFVFNH
jgi:hypothetical protein